MTPLFYRYHRLAVTLLFGSAISLPVAPTSGQPIVAIPNAQVCIANNRFTGQPASAVQVVGQSLHWAHADWLPNGVPIITYGPTYFTLPPVMQIFTSIHECGHITLQTSDEFQANCFALRRIWPSPDVFNFLSMFHQSLGALPPQYGGSGMAFWNGTLAACR